MQLNENERHSLAEGFYRSVQNLAAGRPIEDKEIRGLSADLAACQHKASGLPASQQPNNDHALFLPLAALVDSQRTLATNTFTGGGSMVGMEQSFFELALTATSVCAKAGARVLAGLNGNLNIPTEATKTTFSWLSELSTITESDSTVGALTLTPHRLGGATSISNQLNAQAGPILTSFLLQSLTAGIGAAFDYAALQGSGSYGEPMGLHSGNSANIQTVSFSGSPTWTKALSLVSKIATASGDDSKIAFVAHPGVREVWMRTSRTGTGSLAIWSDATYLAGENVAGKPAYVTTNSPATYIAAADFSQMILATFGEGTPVKIIVDPYSLSLPGKIRFVAQLLGDVGLLHGGAAACRSTDSAIQ